MYICSVLLYRCYLSVYSPFLLIVDVHSVVCLMPVCGEVGLKPCASCVSHTNGVSLFTNTREQRTIKCTKRALWVNRPAALSSSSTLGINYPKSLVTAACFTWALWDSTYSWHSRVGTNSTVRLLCLDTKHKSVWFLTSAHEAQAQPLTTLSTNGEFHHAKPSQYQRRLFAVNVHCKKNMEKKKRQFFLAVYCFLRLSLSTPVLNFPSRFLKLFKICDMLDRPGASGAFVLYFLQSSRAVGLHFEGGMSHHGAQYYLYARWVEQPPQSVWRWSEPVITSHCCNPDSNETFVICSTFSVFNIKFLRSVFWISKKECIFTVKCCD